jgi:hypothetical protein
MRWAPGSGVIQVAGQDMGMQVRNDVPQRQVVQLDRIEQGPDRPPHREHFVPISVGLLGVEVGGFCDVTVLPCDDAIAGEESAPLQVDLSELPGEDLYPKIVVAVPQRCAYRAALAGHPLDPVCGPLAISHASFNHRPGPDRRADEGRPRSGHPSPARPLAFGPPPRASSLVVVRNMPGPAVHPQTSSDHTAGRIGHAPISTKHEHGEIAAFQCETDRIQNMATFLELQSARSVVLESDGSRAF